MGPPGQKLAQASSSQYMPSSENLDRLLQKFLALFGTESILSGKALPEHPLQRESSSQLEGDAVLKKLRPMSGNDFHLQPSMSFCLSWEALLQLSRDDDVPVVLQLSRLALHQHLNEDQAQSDIQRVARLVWESWPEPSSEVSGSVGTFTDPALQLMRWITAKGLTSGREGAAVRELSLIHGAILQPFMPERRRHLDARKVTQGVSRDLSQPESVADAQLWSFSGPDFKWVLSLPLVATMMLLMSNPDKKPLLDNPDRDLSWYLDSLQGYCRLRSPHEGPRPHRFIFGTYPDHWMHLHFVMDYLRPTNRDDQSVDDWKGNGIRIERRTCSIPIGDDHIAFREGRIWIGMRTATSYNGVSADKLQITAPSTVAFVVADQGYPFANIGQDRWLVNKLNAVPAARGVVLFQMLVWDIIDEWKGEWATSIWSLESCHDVELKDLQHMAHVENKRDSKVSGKLCEDYLVAGHALRSFVPGIKTLPQSIRDMRDEWGRAFPPYDETDVPEIRFGMAERCLLMENWDKLVAHADDLQQYLLTRIGKRLEALDRLRNNILLERLCATNKVSYA